MVTEIISKYELYRNGYRKDYKPCDPSNVLSNEDNRLRKRISATLVIIFVAALYVLLVISVVKPKAIDVYRGKTTLEIMYKNNIPIDTVVTYKDK